MMHEIAGNNHHHQTRIRLQSEKSFALSGEVSAFENHGDMRVLGFAVENLLKYIGLHDRAKRNCFDYRLEKNEVYLPDLPADFEGYSILHLSDLHADELVDEGKGIISILENVPCDLAVLTGDFSFEEVAVNCKPCLEALIPIVHSISVQDGIFGVLGNHDLLEMLPDLERMGVHILLNDAAHLRRGSADIVLAGIDDPHFYKCHDLKKALSTVNSDQIVILLSHSPEIALEASTSGVDFCLCGHTHGGQICLPGGVPLYANISCNRSYVSGNWTCKTMQGYTSRGIGFSCAAARFFCPPEITLHTLHSGKLKRETIDSTEGNFGRFVKFIGHAVFT